MDLKSGILVEPTGDILVDLRIGTLVGVASGSLVGLLSSTPVVLTIGSRTYLTSDTQMQSQAIFPLLALERSPRALQF